MTADSVKLDRATGSRLPDDVGADWHRRVVGRSFRTAAERSVGRGMNLIRAATTVLARAHGEDITVQDVADEAGQSLRSINTSRARTTFSSPCSRRPCGPMG
jgi:hypothetical protein